MCIITELLTDYGWLEIDEDCPWDVFTGSGLTEEGVEGVISTSNGLVTGHLSIRLDSVFQTVELPAGITDLDTSLSDMDGDTLTLEQSETHVNFEFVRRYSSSMVANIPMGVRSVPRGNEGIE